jgi:two-component system response regulator DevR
MTEQRPVRVFLVDDHEIVRRGVREVIDAQDDLEVVGEAGSVDEARLRIPVASPTVVLLDVRLPDGNGVELCRDLRARDPDLQCLMLTSYADDEALTAAVLAGAAGFLLKQIRGTDIVDAIRRAARGEVLLDARAAALVRERLQRRQEQDELLARLTQQEQRILSLIAEGLTNRQIAETMFLAEKTVKNYVSNVLAKLGMDRRTQAAVYRARLDRGVRSE